MDVKVRRAFLILLLAQAAHSVDEYVFRLYDGFLPARFLSGLVSSDLQIGFAVLNGAFLVFGMWCYLARVRPGHPSAPTWAWPWVALHLVRARSVTPATV